MGPVGGGKAGLTWAIPHVPGHLLREDGPHQYREEALQREHQAQEGQAQKPPKLPTASLRPGQCKVLTAASNDDLPLASLAEHFIIGAANVHCGIAHRACNCPVDGIARFQRDADSLLLPTQPTLFAATVTVQAARVSDAIRGSLPQRRTTLLDDHFTTRGCGCTGSCALWPSQRFVTSAGKGTRLGRQHAAITKVVQES
mmetsp:Transcript_50677/g.147458  ORF Transcript_50677/g.147458 Transcript_50677/m.147458 type:complete len:200 (+) Transcript_50677:110-709(+)